MQGSLAQVLTKRGLEDLELKLGLLGLTEALLFLHSTARLALLSLSAEHVFVTRRGEWKLGAGLSLAQPLPGPGEPAREVPWTFQQRELLQPPLSYVVSPPSVCPLRVRVPSVWQVHGAGAAGAAAVQLRLGRVRARLPRVRGPSPRRTGSPGPLRLAPRHRPSRTAPTAPPAPHWYPLCSMFQWSLLPDPLTDRSSAARTLQDYRAQVAALAGGLPSAWLEGYSLLLAHVHSRTHTYRPHRPRRRCEEEIAYAADAAQAPARPRCGSAGAGAGGSRAAPAPLCVCRVCLLPGPRSPLRRTLPPLPSLFVASDV